MQFKLSKKYFVTVAIFSFAILLSANDVHAQQKKPPQKKEQPNGPSTLKKVGRGLQEAMLRMTVPKSRLTDSPDVRSAFREVVKFPTDSTVRIQSDGKDAALGGIVGRDGWILTKASRVKGKLKVKFKDGKEFSAKLVGIQDKYDLAMLKIDAHNLPTLQLAREKPPIIGQWVATPGIERDPVAIGVVSVNSRVIPKRSGVLGVQLGDAKNGVRIDRVVPSSGAAKAGFLINDIIISVNGKKAKGRAELVRIMRTYSPGETVKILIRRGKKEMTLRATLTDRVEGMTPNRSAMQNSMGSTLSQRRYGFPNALQHDTVLRPQDCGGPLVNLDGETIGFNISRSGRTETYAIPTPIVLTLMYDLMSGNLAPEKIKKKISTTAKKISDKKAPVKKADSKKMESKKAEPKKTKPKKAEPKKITPKKEASKKTEQTKSSPEKTKEKKSNGSKAEPKRVAPQKASLKKEKTKDADTKTSVNSLN